MVFDQVRELFDYKDGLLIWKEGRRGTAAGDIAGSVRKIDGRRQVGYKRKIYLNYRLVYLWHHGYMPDRVDHINGDQSDDRIENLRECTANQNSWNSKVRKGLKNIYKTPSNTWKVQIKAGDKKHDSTHKTLEEAIKVAERVRQELHGDYARGI